MHKIIILLFTLSMLCHCKEQQPTPKAEAIPEAEEKFDSSINKVVFAHKKSGRHNFSWDIVVTKTETGAVAKYDNYSQLEFQRGRENSWKAELSAKEWQNFIRALQNLRYNEWQKEYSGTKGQLDSKWNLDIFSSNEKEAASFSGKNAYPTNWEEFSTIIDDVTKKIITKTEKESELPIETKLKMEYEKKFRKPISDFELSTKEIEFSISKEKKYDHYISISRTSTGAILQYGIHSRRSKGMPFQLNLSLEEWLDFVRALHKCNIDGWAEKYESSELYSKIFPVEEWSLVVYSSDKYDAYKFSGKNSYPPSWKEFKKIMDGMMARIGKIKKDDDDKLKAEYQKKFGELISNLELSIRNIKLRDITIFKTETGAVADFSSWGKMELSSEEWLDLIRTLHKCNIDEWIEKYNDNAYSDSRWKIQVFSLEGYKVFGGDTYPPGWDELAEKILDIGEKIKKAPYIEIEEKLKTEYQKRFGEPISEFELSIKKVYLDTYGVTSVSRTETGATAYYFLAKQDFNRIDMELTTEEWLDFIRTLRKCQVDEWKDEYGEWGRTRREWDLQIALVDGGKRVKGHYDISPPNWSEFKKAMDKIQARIKAEPARKRAEEAKLRAKFSAEYRKKYGTPATNFELAKVVRIWNGESEPSSHTSMLRTATGAIAEFKPWGGETLKLKLSTEEWLNFIGALSKIRSKWNKKYGKIEAAYEIRWQLETYFSDEEDIKAEYIYEGSDLHPANWNEYRALIDNLETRIKKEGVGEDKR